MFAGLFHVSAHRARIRYAKAKSAVAAHNQMAAVKAGSPYSMGLDVPERPEPILEGMDAVQALAYDAERWPHCMDLPTEKKRVWSLAGTAFPE